MTESRPPEVSADMLVESISMERGMSWLPPVVLTLTAACAAAYWLQWRGVAELSIETLLAKGALHRPEVLAGELWRLVSSKFLHADFGHIASNAAGLYLFGALCEHSFGKRFTFAAYLWSGIAGSLLTVAFSDKVSLGASGAVFGLGGLLASSFYRRRERLQGEEKRIGLVLLLWGAQALLRGYYTPGINNFAHGGGFLCGMLFASLAVPRQFRDETQPSSRFLTGLALSAAVALALALPKTVSALIRGLTPE